MSNAAFVRISVGDTKYDVNVSAALMFVSDKNKTTVYMPGRTLELPENVEDQFKKYLPMRPPPRVRNPPASRADDKEPARGTEKKKTAARGKKQKKSESSEEPEDNQSSDDNASESSRGE